jgi:hypothetical protein
MCCMCLLRGLKGRIRVIYLTSRLSVSSWPPKLPSSSPDAHWPPLEAWHLGYTRTASTCGVYPLTCEEEEGEGGGGSCAGATTAECAAAVAAAECTTALPFAPSRRPPALMTTAPSNDPKMPSHHFPQASRASFLSDCLCLCLCHLAVKGKDREGREAVRAQHACCEIQQERNKQ